MVLDFWTTLLKILLTPRPEIWRGARLLSVSGEIIFFSLPGNVFRNPSGTNAIRMFWWNSGYQVFERALCFYPLSDVSFCDTFVMSNLFMGHQLWRNQLILICTDNSQDCFLITDWFLLVCWFCMAFSTSLSSWVQFLFSLSFRIITHDLWTSMVQFIYMCGLHGLLPTSVRKFHVNSSFRNLFTDINWGRVQYLL